MSKMNVNESIWQFMTTKVVSITPDTPAEDIKNFFQENKFHHIPVVNAGGLLKGIISSTDLIKMERLMEFWQITSRPLMAKDIMTSYPFFLTPDDSIATAIELFLENRFHALPIVEDEVLVGIITTHDILELTMKLPEMVEEDH